MNYVIICEWTDGNNKWFTVKWSNGNQTTHCMPV